MIWSVHIFSLSVGMFHSASRQKNKVEQGPSGVNVDKTFQCFGLFSPSLLHVSGVAVSSKTRPGTSVQSSSSQSG